MKINENGIAVFGIPLDELKKWDMKKHGWTWYPGDYKIVAGGNSADEKLSSVIPLGRKSKK
ncbi:MAG: hypothetical protein ABI675_25330 [Chitinophagaceae bacterium]